MFVFRSQRVSTDQVLHWVVWVMKEFSMTDIDLTTLNISGNRNPVVSAKKIFSACLSGEILESSELLRNV